MTLLTITNLFHNADSKETANESDKNNYNYFITIRVKY